MSRFKKHLGEGKLLLVGGDEFLIKPLTTDEAPLFLKIMKLTSEGSFDLNKLDDEAQKAITEIINITLQKSFPEEWKTEQEELKAFGLKYLIELLLMILDVNSPDSDEKESKVEELKEKLKQK